jgi:hypothetical protein
MGPQVPHPTHISKSQHGRKVPTFGPQETIETWVITIKSWILITLHKNIRGTLCRHLGLAFCSTQPSTQAPSLTSKKCCHVGIHVILGTQEFGTPCEVVFPTFMLSTPKIAQINLERLGT